jgi:hypothetical protein
MKRVLLITLSLVLALVSWSTVGAEDGFYVIPAMRGKYAPVPKTGQTNPYGLTGTDGALKKGVAWPTPRFTDNHNGTVTDNLTRLIWMKNANAFVPKAWDDALTAANGLKSGDFDLTDGSKAGDWRLPNLRELQSLVDYGSTLPALPANHPFTGVVMSFYWSSSTNAGNTAYAGYMSFGDGTVSYYIKGGGNYVWCVRGGP